MRTPARALILDVDGVVSPINGPGSLWGDDIVVGNVFGPVLISRELCDRLDRLSRVPGVGCWWLTSWTAEMRSRMDLFPGRDWPAIAEQGDSLHRGRTWWKLTAVETWLERHPEIQSVAWCDDHLRGGRPASVRRRFAVRGVDIVLVAPSAELGLTPGQIEQVERWADPSPWEPRAC